MSRVMVIVGLVGCMMANAVASASPVDQVRVPVTVAPGEGTGGSGGSVTVMEGDHLWKISARHLGAKASNDVITPYWREVIEVNTPQLRSRDPDLIYPGEIVELPVPPER